MADLTISELDTSDNDGLDVTAAAAAAASGGDAFINDGKTLLLITNEDSGTPTVTVSAQLSSVNLPGIGSLATTNKAVTLAAGNTTKQYHVLGPFPKAIFNDGNGKCQITYSAVTNLKVLPLRMKGV